MDEKKQLLNAQKRMIKQDYYQALTAIFLEELKAKIVENWGEHEYKRIVLEIQEENKNQQEAS